MINGSIYQEDVTPINIYVPQIGTSKYIKQKEKQLKGEINNSTIIHGNFI